VLDSASLAISEGNRGGRKLVYVVEGVRQAYGEHVTGLELLALRQSVGYGMAFSMVVLGIHGSSFACADLAATSLVRGRWLSRVASRQQDYEGQAEEADNGTDDGGHTLAKGVCRCVQGELGDQSRQQRRKEWGIGITDRRGAGDGENAARLERSSVRSGGPGVSSIGRRQGGNDNLVL